MRAVVATTLGSPDVLELVERERPRPKPGQVLVRVHASSVNPIDTKVRRFDIPMTPKFPAVLQGDVAGVVEAVGEGVGRFREGDEVFGCAGGIHGLRGDLPGALAEYMAADADLLALKPRSLDFRQAAALPLVSLTAWIALRIKARLDASKNVLIHGGTGGVGHVAVQIAKAAGARVFTTVSTPEKAEIARGLGADVVLNHREMKPEEMVATQTGGRGFDVVFDTVGGEVMDASFRMVRPEGEVVTIVGNASHNLAPLYLRGTTLHTVIMLLPMMYDVERDRQGLILDQVRHLADTGRLKPLIDPQRFTLETVADAHRKLEAGQALGKLVIDVGP